MIRAARRLHHAGHRDLQRWGDHEAAFRQLLVEAPELALLILFAEYGPTSWQNHVLLFGATGSVWGYGRFADFLMHVGRLSLLALIFHYVDDFHGMESSATAGSAFVSFEDLNVLSGCRMKQAKRAPLAACQDLLGVQLDVSTTVAIVQPTPKRRAKLEALAQRHLDAGKFSPAEAGSFAGMAEFFDSITLGRVGRGALKPVFARQHAKFHTSRLSLALAASFSTFCRLARIARPRALPLDTSFVPVPVIYADAYFALGDQKFRACDLVDNRIAFSTAVVPDLENGFGAILFPVHGKPLYFSGALPAPFLAVFAQRGQFIFLLEALVQIPALFVFHNELSGLYISFVDNTAAQFALAKAYSTDDAVNTLASIFWTTAGVLGFGPWFERVSSQANISDKISPQDFSDVARLQASQVLVHFEKVWPLLLDAVHNHQFAAESVGLRAIDLLLTSSLP